jgi:hypothetical protein
MPGLRRSRHAAPSTCVGGASTRSNIGPKRRRYRLQSFGLNGRITLAEGSVAPRQEAGRCTPTRGRPRWRRPPT